MLSDDDRTRLRIEGKRWRDHGTKEAAVRDQLDETMTTFAARVNRVIDTAEAEAEMPVVVARLRRVRAARWAARSGCAHGTHT